MYKLQYALGDKVIIKLQPIKDGNSSVKVFPCSSFVNKIAKYEGQVDTVERLFPPGYEMNIQFEDGAIFHVKPSWIEDAQFGG